MANVNLKILRGTKCRKSKKARQCNGQCKFKDIKGEPKVVNQRRPDNAMDLRLLVPLAIALSGLL
jgi:hypothetical protein